MTQFVQIHLITSYPPANLNRDDSGRPKTAVFGGVQRLRVSSQSLKRAWRTSDYFLDRLSGHVGKRTQRIGEVVLNRLLEGGMSAEKSMPIARSIAGVFGKLAEEKDNTHPSYTKQLVFVSPDETAKALDMAEQALKGDAIAPSADTLLQRSDGAVDIAMFGRMLAEAPSFNREAAVQVAHALSTHRVIVDDDYYVAVDDLKRSEDREDAGTSFIGVQEFAASTLYLYLCIDVDLLVRNLGGHADLAADGMAALIEAAAKVAPGGKQASFASRARASYVLAEVGSDQPRTLAAAFLKPIDAKLAQDEVALSVDALRDFRDNIDAMYGVGDVERRESAAMPMEGAVPLEDLIDFVRGAVHGVPL